MSKGWYAFDLDGTLAHYDGWKGVEHIGEPIWPMVDLARSFIDAGADVRIFTARLCNEGAEPYIQQWCLKHFGRVLLITNIKDRYMSVLYDDRARQVEHNTGRVIGE